MPKLSDLDLLKFGHTITLVGSVYGGEGRVFIAPFPEEVGAWSHADSEVLEMDQADWERLMAQQDTLETEVTARAGDGTMQKAILRKSSRAVDQNVNWQVFRRDGYACRYCGRNDVPLSVDHLVCWEKGGPSTAANMLTACKPCNKARGNTSYADWLRHPHYLRVSGNLTPNGRALNEAIVATLDLIPLRNYVKSRG